LRLRSQRSSVCALGAHGNSGYNDLLETKTPVARVNC
jgi:hypothetical protein